MEILLLLATYGDEFVQDSHLFPFSPVPIFHVAFLILYDQRYISIRLTPHASVLNYMLQRGHSITLAQMRQEMLQID